MRIPSSGAGLLALFAIVAVPPAPGLAQDPDPALEDEDEGDLPPLDPDAPTRLELTPTLPDVEEAGGPEEQGPPILEPIRGGQGPIPEEEKEPEPEPTLLNPRIEVVPDPSRQRGQEEAGVVLPQAESEEPKAFTVAGGVGGTILFTESESVAPARGQLGFVRFEERFEWRPPDTFGLRIGVHLAQNVNGQEFFFQAGPRLGLGAYLFETRRVSGEAAVVFVPGVATGEFLGTRFELYSSLDFRIVVDGALELIATAALGVIDGSSWGYFTGSAGYAW
ncbi:MAG: hypothetical protein ACFCGT_16375 [Sandaracinaceae bacterium]